MGSIDLVVAISADQQQVLHVRLGQEILEHIERCRIEPLQIVEEQRQRMFRLCEHPDESPKNQLEPPLRVLRRKFGNWRLLADDELEFGDKVHHEPSVRPQRFKERVAPAVSSASLFARRLRMRL